MHPDKLQALTPVPLDPEVRDAMAEIAVLTRQEVARVPEPVFRQRLLPILTNTDGNVDITPWQDLAGTVTRPIDVIDGGGKVLFRVPSLFQPIPTSANGDPRNSFTEILSLAKKKTEMHPVVGQAFLDDRLGRKIQQVGPDLERVRQWNQVLAFYNLPQLPIAGAPASAEAAPVSDVGSVFSGEDDDL